MTSKTSKTLRGTTTVTVGATEYKLTPTLGAVRAIEAHFGGLMGAVRAVREHSVDGCANLIAAGAGLDAAQAAALPEEVWQAGVVNVGQQLVSYVSVLLDPRGAEAAAGNEQAAAQ